MKNYEKNTIKFLESALAIFVLIGVLIFGYNGFGAFFVINWSNSETFYAFISFILLLLVGIELIRLMISHSLETVLELLIVIIARKMLDPKIDPFGILLNIIALAILIGINYIYAKKPLKSLEDLTQ